MKTTNDEKGSSNTLGSKMMSADLGCLLKRKVAPILVAAMAIHSLSLSAARIPGKGSDFSQPIQQTISPLKEAKNVLSEARLTVAVSELKATQGELKSTKDEVNALNLEVVSTLMELTALKVELFARDMELAAQKQVYRVPQTGQDVCWDNVSEDPTVPHSAIPCEGSNQGGARRAGLAPPDPEVRFTDNGDGTITDNFTNLIWLKAGDCIAATSWEEALDAVANLHGTGRKFSRCSLTDQSVRGEWRLPNVNEIMSLMDYGNIGPCLPEGHSFELSLSPGQNGYWTSTTYALPSEFSFEGRIFPKESQLRYGQNLSRFGDAYVAKLGSGELVHMPKDGRGRGKVPFTYIAGVMAVRERYSPTDRRNPIYQEVIEGSSNRQKSR
ncbi:MAG: DUF1566 domain-containing protein [Verrucomicrobia bacterium]|jgi:hypothetical protein|nr:DUF1566 domain-containing protein [Verrucomicrobiota bacterium]